MSNAITKGSLSAIATQNGTSLAESFLDVDAVVIIDTSASMNATDTATGRSRYEQACKELETLQASMPGKIAVISFSSTNEAKFCPGGIPHKYEGRTDVAGALTFAKLADVSGMRFVLISDGEPDDAAAALAVARTYTSRIDTIFVGDERRPTGRDFLKQLATASGGQNITSDRVQALAANVQQLLTATR
jgi:hypothetical protein